MTQEIRGKIKLEPLLSVEVIRCDNSVVPKAKTAVAKLSLEDFASHVVVPVQRKSNATNLLQETAPNWDRYLILNYHLGSPHFHSPVLLSPRNGWYLKGQNVEIFDRATVVDGAKRLEAALHFHSLKEIPVTIILGLNPDEELNLRRQILSNGAPTIHVKTRERVGTTAPRLTIEDLWIDFEIQSDPFVVPTSRGYSPAILVRRENTQFTEHVLVGARSLAQELETFRSKHGTLVGVHISVRKNSPERTSPYILHVNAHPKGSVT